MRDDAFSSPFNWCDGACRRCLLAGECTLARRLAGQRWVHEMRHEDPDDPAVAVRDAVEHLKRSRELLERDAAEAGIDLDQPIDDRPSSLLAARLNKAAQAYVLCACRLLDEADRAQHRDGDALDRAASGACVVGSKVARIAGHVSERDDEAVWQMDAVPNLLLVERMDAEVSALVGELGASLPETTVLDFDRARADLVRALRPWIDEVPPEARATLGGLLAARRAPSPFCTT